MATEEETAALEQQEVEETGSEELVSEMELDDKDKEIERLKAINKEVITSRDKAKTKLRGLEKTAETARNSELEEQGKFETLYNEEKDKRVASEGRLRDVAVSSALSAALTEANASSVDTALALVDKGLVALSDDGTVDAASVADAIAKVKEQHEVLFTGARKGPTNARAGEEEPNAGYEAELRKIVENQGKGTNSQSLSDLRAKYGRN